MSACRVDINRGSESWITLGQAFLQNFYTIYDFENPRIGFYVHQFSNGTIGETVIPNNDPVTPTGDDS